MTFREVSSPVNNRKQNNTKHPDWNSESNPGLEKNRKHKEKMKVVYCVARMNLAKTAARVCLKCTHIHNLSQQWQLNTAQQ